MRIDFHGITLEIVQGNIAEQKDVEVVVNTSHPRYQAAGGVSAAIHEKAGPGLIEHCRLLAPLQIGQAVMTPAFNLPNKCIIHCLGPQYGPEKSSEKLLARCYTSAVSLAERHQLTSIAFPAISTGALGFPIRECALISLTAVIDHACKLRHVRLLRFVLHSSNSLEIFRNTYVKILWNKRIITDNFILH
jgi:O-acetyl-ADP-ribose deacetylase (regulator of RNase III)